MIGKIAILILTINLFVMTLFSQSTEKIVSAKSINWLGLDFTRAKLIGSIGFTDPHKICYSYIHHQWNSLLFGEYEKKYNLGSSLGRKEVQINFDIVNERNGKITPDSLVIDEPYIIQETEIPEIIKDYPLLKNDGINAVFIVESFNKHSLEGHFWVTFFDPNTNELIHTIKMTGKPRGFGIRNYWAYCIYEVIKQLRDEYSLWR